MTTTLPLRLFIEIGLSSIAFVNSRLNGLPIESVWLWGPNIPARSEPGYSLFSRSSRAVLFFSSLVTFAAVPRRASARGSLGASLRNSSTPEGSGAFFELAGLSLSVALK